MELSQPRVGVGIFVFRDYKDPHFILGQRKGSNGAGTYALPGGHLEYGESFEGCAAREIQEETGLEVTDIRFLTATNSVFRDAGKHYVTIFMSGIAKSKAGGGQPEPKLLEPDKCEGWFWSTFNEMANMPSQGQELFLPILALMNERPALCRQLVNGPQGFA